MNIGKWIFPDKCVVCGRILTQKTSGVCESCRKKMPEIQEPLCFHCGKPLASTQQEYCHDCAGKKSRLKQGTAIWEYTESMKTVMSGFKYGGYEEDAVFFAKEMLRLRGDVLMRWAPDVIIPVPLHRKKRWFRGYNQAESLAMELGRCLGIPVCPDALRRIRYTKPQKQLDDKKRFENMKRAFSVAKDIKKRPRLGSRVLLVDDIYTTGATMEACAAALQKCGIEEIFFACLCTGRDF